MLISRAKPWICTTVAVLWLLLSFSSRTATPPELALMHANVAAFLPLVVVSLCCSAVYRRTGNFLSPVVAHFFFNLVSIVVLLFS